MDTLRVAEMFTSIQGESTQAGRPCFFVRLSGCNLRCAYCDAPQSRAPGRRVSVREIAARAASSRVLCVLVTGGEPLLQEGCCALLRALCALPRRQVMLETNGSVDISPVPDGVAIVMDIKCPGSGAAGSFDECNLARLRKDSEVKFVVSDRADFDWAVAFAESRGLWGMCRAVLFAPAAGRVEDRELAQWVLGDAPQARFQPQLHRLLKLR